MYIGYIVFLANGEDQAVRVSVRCEMVNTTLAYKSAADVKNTRALYNHGLLMKRKHRACPNIYFTDGQCRAAMSDRSSIHHNRDQTSTVITRCRKLRVKLVCK